MKKKDIRISHGYGEINFGVSIPDVIDVLHEPDYTEELDGGDEGQLSIVYMYYSIDLVAFFEGFGEKLLSILETKDKESTLFGKAIFKMNESEIVDMMRANGFNELDTEIMIWGGKRVTFEDGNIDFFFNEGNLDTVSWGVLILDDGSFV
ncbi:MAG: hypothetical protein U9R32_07930 [Bacteroidota bacterium]|nr:hypothetical protein [Bacteroidota bacterium]